MLTLLSRSALCQQTAGSQPANGRAIFQQRCAKCHGEHGEGVNALIVPAGPSLQAEHNQGQVIMAMEVGPSHMPTFAYVLSVREMRTVADYVTSQLAVVPLTGGDLSEGGKLFRVYCAPCHRTAVRGGALAFTGTNAPDLVGKSPALVAGAIRSGPGPMPSFPRSDLDDRKLASIVRYVEFVQQPPSPGGNPLKWYGPVSEGLAAWVMLLFLIGLSAWIERGGKG